MRSALEKFALCFALVSSAQALRLNASPTSFQPHATLAPVHSRCTQGNFELASLRADVAAHPSDFIAFETESSAVHFIADHAPEAERESEPRVIARGVLGYWRGKTLVVLPSLAASLR